MSLDVPFASVRGMQQSVWNLRHSGHRQSNADDHARARHRCRSTALIARGVNGAQQQVACEIGQQRVRDNLDKAPGTPPHPPFGLRALEKSLSISREKNSKPINGRRLVAIPH
jgi:hypothetical protein